MGVDLLNSEGEIFYLNWHSWNQALETAFNYGWEPMGTIFPDNLKWDGSYFTNDFQKIIEKDAFALAKALMNAVEDGGPSYFYELALFVNGKNVRIS